MPHMKYVKKVWRISYEALFITWRSIYLFSFRFDKLFPASRFMIRECHHQGTRMSAGSTTVLVPSLVHSCPRGIFVSAVCRRSSHVTFIHPSGPRVRGDTKIGTVCPVAERQKWFSSDISVVLKVCRFGNGLKWRALSGALYELIIINEFFII